jgi:hypothetical protein
VREACGEGREIAFLGLGARRSNGDGSGKLSVGQRQALWSQLGPVLPPQGVRRISPVTRAEEFYYPPWKRLLFQLLVSLPLCLACLACVFLLMLGCFQLQVTLSPLSLTVAPP